MVCWAATRDAQAGTSVRPLRSHRQRVVVVELRFFEFNTHTIEQRTFSALPEDGQTVPRKAPGRPAFYFEGGVGAGTGDCGGVVVAGAAVGTDGVAGPEFGSVAGVGAGAGSGGAWIVVARPSFSPRSQM